MRALRTILPALLAPLVAVAPAHAAQWLVPPVDGAVARAWEAPASEFGPGHRGVDYAVPAGTLVRAAAGGLVSFAGPVAGLSAVTIRHPNGLETTYSSLASILVSRGQRVAQGEWLGRSDAPHRGAPPGLHFGVKADGAYVDPAAYLGPVGIAGAIHLAPAVWRPPDMLTEGFRSAFEDPGTYRSACRDAEPIGPSPRPPNDNLAVAVAGIGAKTAGGVAASMYEHGPEQLGYPPAATYRFSYAGVRGPLLHEPFTRLDSYEDLHVAARKLRRLLLRVAAVSPGRHVDLIAHSQGGVVARLFLQTLQRSWDPRLPVIDHLVTFSTPHLGAPLAGDIAGLDEDTLTGGLALDALSKWARAGGPLPDPRSPAAAQLAPGSGVMRELEREDVSFGVRVLALGIANDLVVPADHALAPHERGRVVGPNGLNGHSAIVSSPDALAAAYAFLRDARATCPTEWDAWGPRFGGAISWAEERLPVAYAGAEQAVIGVPGWLALKLATTK